MIIVDTTNNNFIHNFVEKQNIQVVVVDFIMIVVGRSNKIFFFKLKQGSGKSKKIGTGTEIKQTLY
jgi:hypothetical protein